MNVRRLAIGMVVILAIIGRGTEAATLPMHSSDSPAASRSVSVPINQEVVNGNTRYSVQLRIGNGPRIKAILDTGSVGLRVISPLVLNGRSVGNAPIVYTYQSGVQLTGPLETQRVDLGGGVSGSIPIQRVDKLTCTMQKPKCPVIQNRSGDPFARGVEGTTDRSLPAILGINIESQPKNGPNPLAVLGVERWIVELPLPGQTQPGWLILNPSRQQLKSFVVLKTDRKGRAFGCIAGHAEGLPQCSPMLIDTGAPQINLFINSVSKPAKLHSGEDIAVSLSVVKPEDRQVTMRFRSGDLNTRAQSISLSPLSAQQSKNPSINLGVLPFFRFLVLYDPGAVQIAVSKREE